MLVYLFIPEYKPGSSALHICGCHRKLWREEKNCTDEQDPDNSNIVNRSTPSAQRKRALDEFDLRFIELVGENDRHVRDV